MRRSSFTLVELLVVIAAVALLIAVLSPTLQRCRQQAKAVSCSSNIKQLIYGLLMYETQNGTLPYSFCVKKDATGKKYIKPPGGYPGDSIYDMQGWWWFNLIEGFYRDSDSRRSVVKCPSRRITGTDLKDDVLCGNYGVNRSVCKNSTDRQPFDFRTVFRGSPLNTGEMATPDKTLLIVDSGYAMISWWNVTEDPPAVLDKDPIEDTAYIPGLEIVNKNKDLFPGQVEDANDGRHPNKTVNVSFADGHIKRKKADDLLVEEMEDGSYENKSPLWVP